MFRSESPILSYPPPSRISSWISQFPSKVRAHAIIAWERITSFNSRVAAKLKTTSQWVLRFQLATLIAFGFTFMQIREWAAAIAIWVFLGGLLLIRAFVWNGFKALSISPKLQRFFAILGTIVCTVLLIMITRLEKPDSEPWSNLQKLWSRKSVLVVQAHMKGVYGSKATSTQVDLDVSNPPDDAIQNVDLGVSRASKMHITRISEVPLGRDDCKAKPVDLFPEVRATFKGADGDSRATLSTRISSDKNIAMYGSREWSLVCPRLSGRESVRFEVTVAGDAEKDSIQVSGTYEQIPSKGSAVVKVNNVIRITK